jgi:hypothetical protein
MKKAIVTAVVVGLMAGALVAPVEAAKKRKKPRKPRKISRTVTGTYANPALGVPGVVGSGAAGGFIEFPVMAKERFISVQITDDGGGQVMATMSQNSDPSDDLWEIFATFCGKTEAPVPVEPNLAVRISVYTLPGPDYPQCTGPATSGEIKATFTNK